MYFAEWFAITVLVFNDFYYNLNDSDWIANEILMKQYWK